MENIHYNISYCSTSSKSSFLKRTQKEKDSEANAKKKWQKPVKTEQQVKIDFFENLQLLKSKSAKLTKVR